MPTTWVQSTAPDTIPINYNRCFATWSVPPSSFRCCCCCCRCLIEIVDACCSIRVAVIWCWCWHFFQPIWFVHTKWYIDVWTLHRFSLSHVIAIDVIGINYFYYCRRCVHSGPTLVHHIFTLIFHFLLVLLYDIFSACCVKCRGFFLYDFPM